jgi:hypothetical protein
MLMLLVAVSLAADAPSVPTVAELRADELSATAKTLFSVRRYTEAIDKFRESNALRPNTANIYNIGKCHERLGEAGMALRSYREYLRVEPEAEKDAAVQTDIANAEAHLRAEGKQQLVVFTEPATAQVAVDGQPLTGSPAYVELEAGAHQLAVSAEGYATANLQVSMHIDRIAETTVVLHPGSATPSDSTVLVSTSDSGRVVTLRPLAEISARRTTAIVLGASGVAILGAGILFGVLAKDDYKRAEALQNDPSEAKFNTAKSAAVRDMVLANVGYAVGAVSLAVGLYFAITGGLFGRGAGPRVGVAPLSGGGLVVLSGPL